jgi:hypothetical protein
MKIRKKVTPAKAAANRNNAKHSTGPTTKPGKDRASRNAITHGIFAPGMLLPGESKAELDQLRSEMMTSHAPVGIRESSRVDKLVWNEWCWRRFCRAQTGEIAKRLADHQPAAEMAASTHIPQYNLAATALNQLEKVEGQIRSEGRVSADNLELIRKLPYHEPVNYFLQVIKLVESAERRDDISATSEMPAEEGTMRPTYANAGPSEKDWEISRDLLLDGLDVIKQAIGLEKLHHTEHLGRRSLAIRDACLVAQEADLNRLTRYEDHLLRHRDRDELALERMQRLRRGEKVPPPTARVN